MVLSVHCLYLEVLAIHFKTQTIVEDMKKLVDDRTWDNKLKCKLQYLSVGELKVNHRDSTVRAGLKLIFLNLEGLRTYILPFKLQIVMVW